MRLSLVFQIPLVVLSAFLLAGSVAHAEPDTNKPNFDIVTLSNRADLVSGGAAGSSVASAATRSSRCRFAHHARCRLDPDRGTQATPPA